MPAFNETVLRARIATLHDQCLAESKKGQEEAAKNPGASPWGQDPMVCDPNDLAGLVNADTDKADIQSALGLAQLALDHTQRREPLVWPYGVSIAILVIIALPCAWYFLLRRVRDLSDAIRGN
jgi:hypothetical protein